MTRLSPTAIRAAVPPQGFFKGKEWLSSPEPLRLRPDIHRELTALGELLGCFLEACEDLYFSSRSGTAPRWVAELLDQGKPDKVVSAGVALRGRPTGARVIRPDILLSEQGLSLTEIDATPGGIGLTGWLNQLYADAGWPVVGGGRGMLEGFRDLLAGGRVIFSREALDYRPEIEWIVSQIHPAWQRDQLILKEADFKEEQHAADTYYRYFELWDLDHVSHAERFLEISASGRSAFTAPMKAFLEEKLWLALLWTPGLRPEWIARLGAPAVERLRSLIPQGWVLDPAPIPHHAVHPGLGIQSWSELSDFSQKERQLVLKISGFSERAWGSRGVTIGHDIRSSAWKQAIESALESFPHRPHILQRFHSPRIVEHPFHDRTTGEERVMEGRVRLCPYYFWRPGSVTLAGVLATICPKEKKVIHGMRDAIMVPCSLEN